mmetsp:Transcript_40993/g.68522  ORF Transcript_40993/g.68522 Transcript_40993/m.68522 type:complete len:291 (-) Transcript_40993:54-926(-)
MLTPEALSPINGKTKTPLLRSPSELHRLPSGGCANKVVVLKTLLVDPQADGDDTFKTLDAALVAAAKGDTIQLKPGLYDLPKQIDVEKSVHIEGLGSRGDVVLQRSGFSGFVLNLAVVKGSGSIRNLTMTPKKGSRGVCGVHIRFGDWLIEHCDIQGSAATGTAVLMGADANGTVRGCWLHGSDVAVDIENGLLDGNDVYHSRDCILARSKSDRGTVVIRRNRLYDFKELGIWAGTQGSVLVEENEVWNVGPESISADKTCTKLEMRKNKAMKGPTDQLGKSEGDVGRRI